MSSQLFRTSLRALVRPSLAKNVVAVSRITPRVMPAFQVARPFSSTFARMSTGSVDSDLVHKLDEELQYEKSNEESEPEFIKEFLEANSFKLEDKPGVDEVSLTRTFGNEKIRVLFSISDINNTPSEGFLPEDDMIEPGNEEDEEIVSFPVRASVTIEKDGQGAVTIDTVAQDGEIVIESVMYYKDNKLANEQSAEADWQRRGLYIGPQFSELDENLQQLYERYLEERGINSALANFLPDYIEYKEQKEYIQWLDNMKKFVAA
ncbi:mitochondrial glyco protein [Rhizopus microsporus ATCC 52813]|uniref:Mitochondrial glyco protein n=1 Tax=Rhizopus microsporus ATCC 52813 TaxID=1340429 RepID=A0A2G4SJI0_RHIZD|nr:mitochondrial glyco protein [Rhizopus microsporus ATCC 52813]PHZ08928.1 mitochondrial glyco protein [Rhizopus microsporus ATCC 52813]